MLLDIAIDTLSAILARVKRGFNAEFADPTLDAFRKNNLLYPLATVVGYLLAQLESQARERASQATPFFSTGTNLDAWVDLYGVIVPGEALATGSVEVTGQNNFAIPAGTELVRADGAIFETTAVVNFPALETTIAVGVQAIEPGATYNTAAGIELELALINDDVDPAAVSLGIVGGSDPADEDRKRQLITLRMTQSRTAGTAAFYEELALGSSGSLARVFVVPAGYGPSSVVFYPLLVNPAGSEYWELTLPDPGDVAALQAYLEDPSVARVNDRIYVIAPTIRSVSIDVAITPNTASVQAAILASLRQRFFDQYGAGPYTIANSEIRGAIAAADGELSHTMIDVGGGGALADAVAGVGEILQVGTVTFSTE